MTLAEEDSKNDLKLNPGNYGMNVPSACTIVIIAGKWEMAAKSSVKGFQVST